MIALSRILVFLLISSICVPNLVKAQGKYLDLNKGELKMYYQDEGKGKPIIFIPGWTMTAGFFKHQQEYFKKSYRVISYDPRSQGRSEKTAHGNTYAQHAKDLKEMIFVLDLQDVTLIGWSSGCLTMYTYLEQFGGENIDRLVFIDEPPKWIGDHMKEWVYGTFEGYRGSLEDLLADRRENAFGVVDWMLKEPIDSLERVWMVDEMMMTSDYATLSLFVDGMIADYIPTLKNMDESIPALFLLRESWVEEGRNWIEQYISTAKVMPISSHAMFWEKPKEFNQLLEQFFSKN